MSKFAKPKPAAEPTPEDIERVIAGAAAHDGQAAEPGPELRFTMTLPPDMAAAIDKSRRRMGLSRLGWLRLAASEKLDRGA